MISDAQIHHESWFEPTIQVIHGVTQDNYQSEQEKGLYQWESPSIPTGTQTITIRYQDDNNNVMWLDTIPILADGAKGDKGDTGPKGDEGKRGGQYWGRTTPASPVQGDTYLDVARMYLMEYNASSWSTVPYTDKRYTVAVQDIIASATSSAQLMQIANAWVANLVAGTVLANQLMAKNLTVLNGGSIQSQNYKAGTSGWRIDSNGRAEFEDGVFRGQVNATSGVFNNVTINENCTINGVLRAYQPQPTIIYSASMYTSGTADDSQRRRLYNFLSTHIPQNGETFKLSGGATLVNYDLREFKYTVLGVKYHSSNYLIQLDSNGLLFIGGDDITTNIRKLLAKVHLTICI